MKVVYASEKVHNPKYSIFLAGPTPREVSVKSWRPEFIDKLRAKGFSSTVMAPENRVIGSPYDFDTQIPWEVDGLHRANLVVFWIPRKLDTMPAFTTNIEFGEFMHSKKLAVGFPPDSVNNRYIKKRCEMHEIPFFDKMDEFISYICEEELKVINMCKHCCGSGKSESNGRFYKCSKCNSLGYTKKKKKK